LVEGQLIGVNTNGLVVIVPVWVVELVAGIAGEWGVDHYGRCGCVKEWISFPCWHLSITFVKGTCGNDFQGCVVIA
jgi:hypothetical protein